MVDIARLVMFVVRFRGHGYPDMLDPDLGAGSNGRELGCGHGYHRSLDRRRRVQVRIFRSRVAGAGEGEDAAAAENGADRNAGNSQDGCSPRILGKPFIIDILRRFISARELVGTEFFIVYASALLNPIGMSGRPALRPIDFDNLGLSKAI